MPTSDPTRHPSPAPRLLSFAFTLGAFALGTSENLIAGLIPHLSQRLGVPVSQVGLLVTAYAGTAVVAGPVLALVTTRTPARRVALTTMTVYALGTILAVAAPSFAWLLIARIVTGAMHTSILVSFMLTALRSTSSGERGRAIGRITLGLGVATVIGVPIGNVLAESLDWRWAFALVAALISSALFIALRALPADTDAGGGGAGWRTLHVLTDGPVAGGIAMTALAGLGAMTLLTFAVPYLTSTGIGNGAVAPLLLLYGASCLAGNVVGARLADQGLHRALMITLVGTGSALLVAGMAGGGPIGAATGLSLVGITYFSTFPPLNTWIATNADGVAPGLALSVNSSAFNIGIALAGWLGAVALSAGLDATRLPFVGAGALALAILVGATLRASRWPLDPPPRT